MAESTNSNGLSMRWQITNRPKPRQTRPPPLSLSLSRPLPRPQSQSDAVKHMRQNSADLQSGPDPGQLPSKRRRHSPDPQDARQELRHRLSSHRSTTSANLGAAEDDATTHKSEIKPLPHGARCLSRWDLAAFKPLLDHYHVSQNKIYLASLSESDVRSHWDVFHQRWNYGELSDGWYEPQMFLHAVRAQAHAQQEPQQQQQQQIHLAQVRLVQPQHLNRHRVSGGESSNEIIRGFRGIVDVGQAGSVLTPPLSGNSFVEPHLSFGGPIHAKENDGDKSGGSDNSDNRDNGKNHRQGRHPDRSEDDHRPSLLRTLQMVPSLAPENAETGTVSAAVRGHQRLGSVPPSAAHWQAGREADQAEQRARLQELLLNAADRPSEWQLQPRRGLEEKATLGIHDHHGRTEERNNNTHYAGGSGCSTAAARNNYRRMLAALQHRQRRMQAEAAIE